MTNSFARSAVFATILLASLGSLTAQVDTGVLTGYVYDDSGAVIPGTAVVVRNTGTNYEVGLETNATGLYVSPPMPPGTYRLTVQQAGFATALKEVSLHLSERLAVDFTLQVGTVAETVTVEAVGETLQTENTTLSTLRTEREVKELPVNSRNFAELLRFSAGVVPGLSQAGGLALSQSRGNTSSSVNGNDIGDNNFSIDGIQNNSNHQGQGIMNFIEVEAIDHYRVETSVPDARFGRSGATINVGYKSGTNEFHGVLFHFLRNDKLDARNYFARGDKAPLRRNFYGGTFGGPVGGKSASTFFFLSYEGQRSRQGITHLSTVPTPRMKSGDFGEHLSSRRPVTIFDPLTHRANPEGGAAIRDPFAGNAIPASRFSPQGKGVIDLYPDPNAGGLAANFSTTSSQPTNGDQGTAKVDHDFEDGSRMFFRFTKAHWEFVDSSRQTLTPDATPFIGIAVPFWQAVISHTKVLSPRTINQARVGYSRQPLVSSSLNGGRNVAEELGIPNVNVDEFSTGLSQMDVTGMARLGDFQFRPAVIVSNNFQLSDNLDANRGNHSIKLGFEVVRRQTNVFQAQRPRGRFQFAPTFTTNPAQRRNTGLGPAELLLGAPRRIDLNGIVGTRGLRRTDWGMYLQDDWKVRSRFTVNLGLRYEVADDFPQSEVYGRMMQFDVPTGNPAPIEGGSGVATDLNNLAPRIGLAFRATDSTVIRAAYGVYYSLIPIALGGTLASNPPFFVNTAVVNNQNRFESARTLANGPLRTSDPNAPNQSRRGIADDFTVPYIQQWNFSIQQQLPGRQQMTVSYVGSKGTGLRQAVDLNQPVPGEGPVSSRRRWPQHANVQILQSRGHYSYHSLQATLVRRFSGGHYQVAYTYSHCLDDRSIGGIPISNLALAKGNCGFDIRQNLRATWGWELPFGRGKTLGTNVLPAVNHLIGGWQVNGGVSLYGGIPFSVVAGGNTLNNGVGGVRPDQLRDGNLPPSERQVTRWFDTEAFANPGFRLYGTAGRNILVGPGTKQIDLSIFKNFQLTEGVRLQFRTEFFNAFNTPQFNNPRGAGVRVGAAAMGRITRAGSEPTLQRTQRQVQMALKLFF
ncbi:MAG: TonB-dependent receptor plug domain-containing protein [Acidobacteriia bacterium]|nr:TonB-dependent receptor plug domain-containing protein [Terriglobia bacterium]